MRPSFSMPRAELAVNLRERSQAIGRAMRGSQSAPGSDCYSNWWATRSLKGDSQEARMAAQAEGKNLPLLLLLSVSLSPRCGPLFWPFGMAGKNGLRWDSSSFIYRHTYVRSVGSLGFLVWQLCSRALSITRGSLPKQSDDGVNFDDDDDDANEWKCVAFESLVTVLRWRLFNGTL